MLSEVSNDPPIQECRAAAEDNLNSEVNSTDKGIQALQNEKDRVARQKEKLKEQLRFFEDVTLADVTIDEDNLTQLSATSRTMVQSIKGVEPLKIGAKVLRQICVSLSINRYRIRLIRGRGSIRVPIIGRSH